MLNIYTIFVSRISDRFNIHVNYNLTNSAFVHADTPIGAGGGWWWSGPSGKS